VNKSDSYQALQADDWNVSTLIKSTRRNRQQDKQEIVEMAKSWAAPIDE